jgi:hypothetical protein
MEEEWSDDISPCMMRALISEGLHQTRIKPTPVNFDQPHLQVLDVPSHIPRHPFVNNALGPLLPFQTTLNTRSVLSYHPPNTTR